MFRASVLVILVTLILSGCGKPESDSEQRLRHVADVSAAQTQISALNGALELYQLDIGGFPTTQQGLEILHTRPADLPNPSKWDGP
ncbi:MAG: type II secretion system protein GspG [Planctomycetia bacterium]|nr:type II secretion system protein GspG [Planctomycetia bacterium]